MKKILASLLVSLFLFTASCSTVSGGVQPIVDCGTSGECPAVERDIRDTAGVLKSGIDVFAGVLTSAVGVAASSSGEIYKVIMAAKEAVKILQALANR